MAGIKPSLLNFSLPGPFATIAPMWFTVHGSMTRTKRRAPAGPERHGRKRRGPSASDGLGNRGAIRAAVLCMDREHGETQAVSRRTGSPREARSEGAEGVAPTHSHKRTGIPRPFRYALASPIEISRKWKIEAARGALRPPLAKGLVQMLPRPGPPRGDHGYTDAPSDRARQF